MNMMEKFNQSSEQSEVIPDGIEKLKSELFVREIPTEIKNIIGREGVRFAEESVPYSRFLKDALANGRIDDEKNLTDLGKKVKEGLADRTFFDLGSGGQHYAFNSVQELGAKRYVGIDHNERDLFKPRPKEWCSLYQIKDDILGFLAKLGDQSGGVFYMAGIEPFYGIGSKREDEDLRAYQEAVVKELWRVTKPGDLVVIGASSGGFDGFDLKGAGFNLITSADTAHFLFQKPTQEPGG